MLWGWHYYGAFKHDISTFLSLSILAHLLQSMFILHTSQSKVTQHLIADVLFKTISNMTVNASLNRTKLTNWRAIPEGQQYDRVALLSILWISTLLLQLDLPTALNEWMVSSIFESTIMVNKKYAWCGGLSNRNLSTL